MIDLNQWHRQANRLIDNGHIALKIATKNNQLQAEYVYIRTAMVTMDTKTKDQLKNQIYRILEIVDQGSLVDPEIIKNLNVYRKVILESLDEANKAIMEQVIMEVPEENQSKDISRKLMMQLLSLLT